MYRLKVAMKSAKVCTLLTSPLKVLKSAKNVIVWQFVYLAILKQFVFTQKKTAVKIIPTSRSSNLLVRLLLLGICAP